MSSSSFRIERLPESRWKECRDLRLEALMEEPIAFGSSFVEEKHITESEWRKRINNAIFALENSSPIGMVVLIREANLKTNHIGNIFGLFVKRSHRGHGIGYQLIQNAIQEYKKLDNIVKIKLAVNKEQSTATKLYSKIGFKIVGTLTKEIKYENKYHDELIMELLF